MTEELLFLKIENWLLKQLLKLEIQRPRRENQTFFRFLPYHINFGTLLRKIILTHWEKNVLVTEIFFCEFEAEFSRSLEQFIRTVKSYNS